MLLHLPATLGIICYDCRPNTSADIDCTKVSQAAILDCPRANYCFEKLYHNNNPYGEEM